MQTSKLIIIIISLFVTTLFAQENQKVSLDILVGGNYSTIRAEEEMETYFYPITDSEKKEIGYDWGLEANFSLTKIVTISTGIHYTRLGVSSNEKMVKFNNSSTPNAIHKLISKTELNYLNFPICAKFGYRIKKHSFAGIFGPLIGWKTQADSYWLVDNKESSIPPSISFEDWNLSAQMGIEYGFQINEKNGVLLKGLYQKGIHDIIKQGPSGTAYTESAVIQLGYRYFF